MNYPVVFYTRKFLVEHVMVKKLVRLLLNRYTRGRVPQGLFV
jgi:hypothetical protein